ncbi:MAG TPA: DUF883 domain-containing protein [Burkholderiaceae bacterium]|nr:DUF883 domain-containing protein [Burkholderiaceae bacterium]
MSLSDGASKDKLLADLNRVMADVDELLRSAGSAAGSELQAHLGDRLRELRQRLEDVEHDAVEQARAAARVTETYVREHPWTSVGVAACIGMVVGALLARR